MKQYMYYHSPINHKFDRADNPKTVLLGLYLNVFGQCVLLHDF